MNFRDVDAIERADDIQGVWNQAQEAFARYGIEHVIYLTVGPDNHSPFMLSTCPEIYANWDPAADPFVVHCCTSYEFTRTGPEYLPTHAYLTPPEQDFIAKAAACGFRAGVGIPVRLQGSGRYGGFNLGTELDRDDFEASVLPHVESLRFISLLAHRRIEELSQDGDMSAAGGFRDLLVAPQELGRLDTLSPREREVTYLIARGLSRKEAARLCGISPNTVAEYVKSAYRKLGVSNRAEAATHIFGHEA